MAKKKINRSRVVEFLQPYSTKKAGEKIALDPLLASNLVNRGVAVYVSSDNDLDDLMGEAEKPKELTKSKKSKKQ